MTRLCETISLTIFYRRVKFPFISAKLCHCQFLSIFSSSLKYVIYIKVSLIIRIGWWILFLSLRKIYIIYIEFEAYKSFSIIVRNSDRETEILIENYLKIRQRADTAAMKVQGTSGPFDIPSTAAKITQQR